jgi:ribosomal protein S18 acetylase RimI-like enzyme
MIRVQIRQATPEDAAAISKLLYESFLEFEALYTREGFAATTPATEQVLARMREGSAWIAVRKNELLGTVAAVVKADSVYMRGMAVLPAARGLGVAARLLEQVEHFAAERGQPRIFLSTTPFLHAAIRLYEKHGFQRIHAGPHDLFGTPLFTMEKRILRQSK